MAKTAKLTTPTAKLSPPSKNFPQKNDFLLCLGMHLQLTPIIYAQTILNLHTLHPLDAPMSLCIRKAMTRILLSNSRFVLIQASLFHVVAYCCVFPVFSLLYTK